MQTEIHPLTEKKMKGYCTVRRAAKGRQREQETDRKRYKRKNSRDVEVWGGG